MLKGRRKKAAKLSYFKSAKLFEQIGVCYYEAAQDTKRASCTLPEKSTPRRDLQNKALSAFNIAQKSGRVSKHIASWKNLILAEQKRDKERCAPDDYNYVKKEQCYIAIRRAYDNRIFAKKFILGDESCSKFKDEYDRLYKRK